MRSSYVFRTASGTLSRVLAVLSLFYLFRGHEAPGGGFVGGLLLSAAVILRALSHGPEEARRVFGIDPRTLVGVGLAIAVLGGVIGLVASGVLFAPLVLVHVPALGPLGTVLLFDLGVYIVVAGTAVMILLVMIEEPP